MLGEVALSKETSHRGHVDFRILKEQSLVNDLFNGYDMDVLCFFDEMCIFMYDSALLLLTTQKLQSKSGQARN